MGLFVGSVVYRGYLNYEPKCPQALQTMHDNDSSRFRALNRLVSQLKMFFGWRAALISLPASSALGCWAKKHTGISQLCIVYDARVAYSARPVSQRRRTALAGRAV